MANNKKIAADVLEAVGGKSNVSFATHCMTRLRFTLKDHTVPDPKAIKKLDGVLGAQESGGQFQIIIGQNVPKVYDELCILGGFSKRAAIDENLDGPEEKLTPKTVGKNAMNYLAGSMTCLLYTSSAWRGGSSPRFQRRTPARREGRRATPTCPGDTPNTPRR